MSKRKEINLYGQYQKTAPGKGKGRKAVLRALPLAILTGALLGIYGACLVKNQGVSEALAYNEEAIADVKLQSDLAYLQTVEAEILELEYAVAETGEMLLSQGSYPVVTSDVIKELERSSGSAVTLNITSYDAASGLLRFDAVTNVVLDIPAYIRVLEDTGLFVRVDYTGYSYAEKEGMYAIAVECYLNSLTGREGGI